jgi:hypothetical protein
MHKIGAIPTTMMRVIKAFFGLSLHPAMAHGIRPRLSAIVGREMGAKFFAARVLSAITLSTVNFFVQ